MERYNEIRYDLSVTTGISLNDIDNGYEDDFMGLREYLLKGMKKGKGEVYLHKPTEQEESIRNKIKMQNKR